MKKKEYFYVSALNTKPDDLESEKITAPVIVLDDLYAISDIRLKDAYYQKIQEWMERNDLWVVLISPCPISGVASVPLDEIFFCNDRGRRFLPDERTAG